MLIPHSCPVLFYSRCAIHCVVGLLVVLVENVFQPNGTLPTHVISFNWFSVLCYHSTHQSILWKVVNVTCSVAVKIFLFFVNVHFGIQLHFVTRVCFFSLKYRNNLLLFLVFNLIWQPYIVISFTPLRYLN